LGDKTWIIQQDAIFEIFRKAVRRHVRGSHYSALRIGYIDLRVETGEKADLSGRKGLSDVQERSNIRHTGQHVLAAKVSKD
jgi:hypothetical protein